MNRRLLSSFMLAASLGFFAGCQTVESRIKENPETFAQLDKATQDKIKHGIIDLGFSEDLVYLAIGKPAQKRKSVSATGQTETWIYYAASELRANIIHNGYYRKYYDQKLGVYCDEYVPATFEDGIPEKRERIQVVFQDGKVSLIEQTKDGTSVGLQPGSPVRVSARGTSGS
jgi:endo-alpha-1,4-polygalactosaminidase (GH114 family)